MARKSRRSYRTEATREPFELDLDNAPDGHRGFVVFTDPHKISTESSYELAKSASPELTFRLLLSDEDYDAWWAEWRSADVEETNKLLEDVQRHYGANPGKLPR